MTTGALMFAFGNKGLDYVHMAAWNANQIRQHLNIPVAVVTDDVGNHRTAFDMVIPAPRRGSDCRYFEDLGYSVPWHNAGRPDAWDLSPWDRTLLVDTDFVIDSAALHDVLHSDQDLLAFDRAHDITGLDQFQGLNHFGQHRIAMWWATVIVFNRSEVAQRVFDCMKMVRANWSHYRDLYGIHAKTYRNDHALTIALAIVDGHVPSSRAIPWTLPTVVPGHLLTKGQHGFRVDFTTPAGAAQYVTWQGMDFHAMGKQHLLNIIHATH